MWGGLKNAGIEAAVGVGEDDFSVMFSFQCDGGKYKLSMAAEETFRIYLDNLWIMKTLSDCDGARSTRETQ